MSLKWQWKDFLTKDINLQVKNNSNKILETEKQIDEYELTEWIWET